MSYNAKIILDSIGPNGVRLTTFEFTIPRFILAELNTHRMLSRNAASSRAIPTEKLLARIEDDPVIPVWWGANQSGMQAREELRGTFLSAAKGVWRSLSSVAVKAAREMNSFGLHKQIANRVVEPWMFTTALVTATEWSNVFALRDHTDAQPEFREVAYMAHELYKSNTPQQLASGEWHLPYVTGYDECTVIGDQRDISVGRCAAVSYLKQDTQNSELDVNRAKKLMAAGHMSPLEHVAQALTHEDWVAVAGEACRWWVERRIPVGNLYGWLQYRKLFGNEHDFSVVRK